MQDDKKAGTNIIQDMFFRWAEQCSCQVLPSPYGARNIGAAPGDLIINPVAAEGEAIILDIGKDQHRTPMRRLAPLTGAGAVSPAECAREVALLAAVVEHHVHFGCGTDLTCPRSLPRPLVAQTHFIEGSQVLALLRTGTMLSGYIQPLMLAAPTNVAIWLTCDGSQYLRQLEQWQALRDLNKTTVSSYSPSVRPILVPPFRFHVMDPTSLSRSHSGSKTASSHRRGGGPRHVVLPAQVPPQDRLHGARESRLPSGRVPGS